MRAEKQTAHSAAVSFDALAAHPDKSVRREFERITSNNLIDTDEATKRLRKLAARAARVKG